MPQKEISLDTYDAICKDKFEANDTAHVEIRKEIKGTREEIHGVRKLLWGLLAAIVLVILTVAVTGVTSLNGRKTQTHEIKEAVEAVLEKYEE